MPTPYWPIAGSVIAELAARAAEEGVGQLHEDARAVALQRIGAGGAAMRQVLQDLQALRDDLVRLAALDVRDEAEATGVVLVRGVVQALRSGRIGGSGRAREGSVHADLDCRRRVTGGGRRASVMIFAKTRRNPSMLRGMLHCGKNRRPTAGRDRNATNRLPDRPFRGKCLRHEWCWALI